MWSKVFKYIKKHKLLKANELYIVALSGGADSVALLLLLHEAGFRVEAAHCNFHLRAAESDRDEAFCEQLCTKLNVPFHRVHFDTRAYAELHKVSIEMAARELRYRWFEQLRSDVGAAGICVAHHCDDSVETVILNLVRGTGLRGLCGIQPRNGHILRPLLCVSKDEIVSYLAQRGQSYVTDSTNMEADVLRNKVRLQVLPLLKSLNPAVAENIGRMSDNLSGAQAVLDVVMKGFCNCNKKEISELESFGSTEYAAYEWLKNFGFNGTQVSQILSAETGGVVTSPTGYDALKDRDSVIVEPSLKSMQPFRIPEEGTYVLADGLRFSVKKSPVFVSKTSDVATLDAVKVRFPLCVRRVEEGDWMIPYGMKGRKLLSDLMTDRKMTLFEKRRQLVVVDGMGSVVWLVGIRVDNRFSVDETTSAVYVLTKIVDDEESNITDGHGIIGHDDACCGN